MGTMLSNIGRRVIAALLAVAALVLGLMVAAPAANAEDIDSPPPTDQVEIVIDGLDWTVTNRTDQRVGVGVTDFTTDAWADGVFLEPGESATKTVPGPSQYLFNATFPEIFTVIWSYRVFMDYAQPELPGPPDGMPEQANRPDWAGPPEQANRPEWAGPPPHAAEPGRPDTNPGKGGGQGRNRP